MLVGDQENDNLPVIIKITFRFLSFARMGVLVACPLFILLKVLDVPGFRFQWRVILSFWGLWFLLWMSARVVVNRWFNRLIRKTIANLDEQSASVDDSEPERR